MAKKKTLSDLMHGGYQKSQVKNPGAQIRRPAAPAPRSVRRRVPRGGSRRY